jgi:O-antigen ligase
MPHLGIDGIAATLLYTAEIVCFLLSVFWRPSIGLYLLMAFLPLQTIRYRLHGYFLGAQFVDVLLLSVMLGLKRQKQPVISKTCLNAALIAYVVYTYLSLFKGSLFLGADMPWFFDDPRLSEWKNYVVDLSLMFFVTVSAIRTKKQMKIMLLVMCIGSLVLAKGFHNIMDDRSFSSFSYSLRDAGPMGWAGVNGLAAFAAQMAVAFTALLLFEKRLWAKVGYFAVVGACSYCLLFALSRGGYAAFLIGIIFLGIVRNRLVLIGVFVFLSMWQGLVPPAVRERVFMTEENGVIDHSAAARLSLWGEAMQVFQADPVFGTGFNTYAYGSHVGGYGDTHNVFVKVLVETGLVGLLLFLAIFCKLFKIGFRLYRTATDSFLKSIGLGLSGLMLTAFVANMFGDRWMYFEITGYTYAFAALAVRAQQMTDEGEPEEEEAEMADSDLLATPA